MDEHRKDPRHRALKAGTIAFDHSAGVDCLVRNLSGSGACLEVESHLGIPDAFTLVIAKDAVKRPCRVAWRSARRIGIRFE